MPETIDVQETNDLRSLRSCTVSKRIHTEENLKRFLRSEKRVFDVIGHEEVEQGQRNDAEQESISSHSALRKLQGGLLESLLRLVK